MLPAVIQNILIVGLVTIGNGFVGLYQMTSLASGAAQSVSGHNGQRGNGCPRVTDGRLRVIMMSSAGPGLHIRRTRHQPHLGGNHYRCQLSSHGNTDIFVGKFYKYF